MAYGEKSWVIDICSQLKNASPSGELELWRKQSIYKVPARIKDLNSKAYKASVASFGPFRHGKEQVVPVEEPNRRALHLRGWRSPRMTSWLQWRWWCSNCRMPIRTTRRSGGETERLLELMIDDGY